MHEPHEIPPGRKVLEAMLMARQQMSQRIDRFDALVHKSRDRGLTERGLDRLLLEPMSALRRVYEVRNGLDAGVP